MLELLRNEVEASPMEITLKNNMPVSAYAAAGVCTVSPDPRFHANSPAVTSLLVAQVPQVDQAHIQGAAIVPAFAGAKRSFKGLETKPSTTLGGFRGVPPRSRPV